MTKIYCVKCGYHETLVNDEEVSVADRCPYCGTEGTLEERDPQD